jgi:CBS domain containing-hemolysin-like protein
LEDPLSTSTILAISIAIVLGAAFSALDAGLIALGEVRLRAISDAGGRHARVAGRAVAHLDRIRARLRTGRVLSLTAAAVTAAHVASFYGDVLFVILAAAIVGLVYSVLAEIGATLAAQRAGTWALAALGLLRPLEVLMIPFTFPVHLLGQVLEQQVQPEASADPERITVLGLERVIAEGEKEGALGQDHADLLRSVLEFKNTVAHEVMVPRTQMIAFEAGERAVEVAALIQDEGHSRYPVYEDRIDQVIGILYAKDLFRLIGQDDVDEVKVGDLIRTPVFFASESQKIGTLLREMQSRRIHLAVVLDEFGGVAGVVTLEDILEEIVGEIEDEHDEEERRVEEVEPGLFLVDAGLSVYDLEDELGVKLRDEEGEYDSVGGMMIELAGHVPAVGEYVLAGSFTLTVREGDARGIRRVEIRETGPVAAE